MLIQMLKSMARIGLNNILVNLLWYSQNFGFGRSGNNANQFSAVKVWGCIFVNVKREIITVTFVTLFLPNLEHGFVHKVSSFHKD